MSILRIYDPPECDEYGAPLDWERCRECLGKGRFTASGLPRADGELGPCAICDGHGSLRAAALAELTARRGFIPGSHLIVVRCENCGHPMSEGTWDPTGDGERHRAAWTRAALVRLRAGVEPEPFAGMSVHYSSCDGSCRHGGPGRWRGDPAPWSVTRELGDHFGQSHQASWRQVDVRTLGWPHDLRPEKLAVLCLRCYAERTK